MNENSFTKGNNFVTRKIAGETIIVPVRAHVGDLDSVYTLNEPGTLIWDLLQEGKKIREITQVICETYDVSPEQAELDVLDFQQSLEDAGLTKKKSGQCLKERHARGVP